MARDYVAASAARDRIELIAGDFFRDDLPAPICILSAAFCTIGRKTRIRLLLSKIYAALPPGGGLLIAEKLLDEDKSGPTPAHMQSLNMLVCTEGRERTLSEYAALLREAGFASVEGGAPARRWTRAGSIEVGVGFVDGKIVLVSILVLETPGLAMDHSDR
jgi:acetylserotonin N-methyltransferase